MNHDKQSTGLHAEKTLFKEGLLQREDAVNQDTEIQEKPDESTQTIDMQELTAELAEQQPMDDRKSKWKIWVKLFIVFFRIGAFTFGGGLAMLPLIEHKTVVKNKRIKHEEIVDVFAVAQSLPGAFALNSSIFVGYRVFGCKRQCNPIESAGSASR